MVQTLLSLWLSMTMLTVTPINDLINKSIQLDKNTVTIEAEVIGEVLERGDYAWINVNDKSNAIGVYLPIEMTKELTKFGDYNNIGDTVRVTGYFTRNCVEHGGELDIHATSITIIKKGTVTEHTLSKWKLSIALIFGTIAGLGYFTELLFLKKKKRKDEEAE